MALLHFGAHRAHQDLNAVKPFSQFALIQKYFSSVAARAAFPLRHYSARVLSASFDLDSIAVIRSRARALPWYSSPPDQQDDMRMMEGAVFSQFS